MFMKFCTNMGDIAGSDAYLMRTVTITDIALQCYVSKNISLNVVDKSLSSREKTHFAVT